MATAPTSTRNQTPSTHLAPSCPNVRPGRSDEVPQPDTAAPGNRSGRVLQDAVDQHRVLPADCAAVTLEADAPGRPETPVVLLTKLHPPVVLWSHGIEAVGRACPAIATLGLGDAVATAPVQQVVLPRLVNALVEQDGLGLVLDDFHRLSSGPAMDNVVWFVQHLPTSVQLVISTRADPALRLATMRVPW